MTAQDVTFLEHGCGKARGPPIGSLACVHDHGCESGMDRQFDHRPPLGGDMVGFVECPECL